MIFQPPVEHHQELSSVDGADDLFPHFPDAVIIDDVTSKGGLDLQEEPEVVRCQIRGIRGMWNLFFLNILSSHWQYEVPDVQLFFKKNTLSGTGCTDCSCAGLACWETKHYFNDMY